MKIKVLEKVEGCFPQEFETGDWIDLYLAETVSLEAPQANKMHRRKEKSGEIRTRDVDFNFKLLPLGVAMEIPAGYEAHLLPRSSAYKDWGILQTNSIGVIDNSFAGNGDEWKLPTISTQKIVIPKGTRIAQFRICLKQNATLWQKLRWLFSTKKVKLVKVAYLNKPDRGGFGTTGKN